MKKVQIYSIILLMWLLFIPTISFAYGADKPDYVGINKGQNIIWKTTFDEGPFEDYLEDRLGLDDDGIEAWLDANGHVCDDETDEDVEAWKIVIIEIKEEKEYDLDETDYVDLEDDEYKGVPFLFNFYVSENYEDKTWDEEETNERSQIYKYNKDLYASMVLQNEFEGRVFVPNTPCTGMLRGGGFDNIFISKDVNWDRVISAVDEEFDDGLEDAGASRPTDSTYLIERDLDGIKVYSDYGEDLGNDDVDEFESTAIYTNDGILKYYEWTYDGEPIYIIELEQSWFIENWWIIAIIAVVALIIIIIIAKKK